MGMQGDAVALVALVALLACAALLATRRREGFPHAGSAMVIVEPRAHRHLRYVVENFDARMPPEYDLYVFHGQSAAAFARDATAGVTRRRVHLVPLPTDNLTVDGYNALLKDKQRFWDKIQAENVLVFQTDAVLCGSAKKTIRNFEHLGYVGCAYDGRAGTHTHWGPNAFWGVGGLSFRKKSVALECLKRVPTTPAAPEDVFYSNCVHAGIGRRPADGREVSEFCSQNRFLARSLGAHRVHDMMHKAQLGPFLQYCPEATELIAPPAAP